MTTQHNKPTPREERVWRIMDAVEAFVAAKIDYERRYATGAEYVNSRDVDETRDALTERLMEDL